MSRQEKNIEKIIDRIIDLEPFDDRMIKKIELKTQEDKTDRIQHELDKLKIIKINTKNELEEIKIRISDFKGK